VAVARPCIHCCGGATGALVLSAAAPRHVPDADTSLVRCAAEPAERLLTKRLLTKRLLTKRFWRVSHVKVDIMKEGAGAGLLTTSTTDESVKKYSLRVGECSALLR
jgi:hypothetical protein